MAKDDRTKTVREDTEHADTVLAPTRTEPLGSPDVPLGVESDETRRQPLVIHPAAEEPPLVGTIGRFRIDGPLGSGGMADVYRAYDPLLHRSVALKVLRVKSKADGAHRRRRLLREARAAAALTHPNTVTIFEVGEADDEVFIAMELLSGSVLRAKIGDAEAAKAVSFEQKLRWLLQGARALAAAHERGLVHRDVKPDNMFVCSDGVLKLLDFGIAKRDEDDSVDEAPDSTGPSSLRTAEGRRVGTPRYMAPEQHHGRSTDARTDEYAWGIVAFELLTGSHPVVALATVTSVEDGKSPRDEAEGARLSSKSARIERLLSMVPELESGAIAEVIARALEDRKEDRFPSMEPIVAALEGYLEGDARAVTTTSARPAAAAADQVARPRTAGRKIALGGIVAVATIGTIGFFAGGKAFLARHGLIKEKSGPATMAPACVVTGLRSLNLGPDDRAAVLPDGDLVTARDIRKGLALKVETPAGSAPLPLRPHVANMFTLVSPDFEQLWLFGYRMNGARWTVAAVQQPDVRGNFVIAASENENFVQRVWAPVSGLIPAVMGEQLVLAVTTSSVDNRFANLPSGAELYFPSTRNSRPINVEQGGAIAPAIATTSDRILFTYAMLEDPWKSGSRYKLRLAVLDSAGERMGDVRTVTESSRPINSDVAFADRSTAVIFWVDDAQAKPRLKYAVHDLANAKSSDAPLEAKTAIDESVTGEPPRTTAMSNGQSVVTWVAVSGGARMIRVAPIGPDGSLLGPTDVARSAGFVENLGVTKSDKEGVDIAWDEPNPDGTRTMKTMHVTCVARAK